MSGKLIALIVVVVLVALYFSQSKKVEGLSLAEYSKVLMRNRPSTDPAMMLNKASQKAKEMLNGLMVSAEPSFPAEGYTSPVGRVRRSPAIVVPGTHIRATSATI